MFILSHERDDDNNNIVSLFEKYATYLHKNREKFPRQAYSLATSDWYFDFHSHECPHDSWLENIEIQELHYGSRHENRAISISMKLLGSYHDGYIMLHYPLVYNYSLNFLSKNPGHRNWRFDEFRLSDEGHLIHEIEWCGIKDTARWVIEASDVIYTWVPTDLSQLSAKMEE